MAFEGIRDRFRELWAENAAKISESSAFNQLREKFDEQTPVVQKAVIFGGAGLVALFLLSFPLGYLSTSRDNVSQFDENRRLIRGLLSAARSAKEPSPLPPPAGPGFLRSSFDHVCQENQISPEQIGEVQNAPGIPKLAPPEVIQTALVANIKQLNLTQIVSVANAFGNIGVGTKLIGLDVVQTAGQDHYYDINVRLVNFGLPAMASDVDSGPPARGGARPGLGSRAPAPPRGSPPPSDFEGDDE